MDAYIESFLKFNVTEETKQIELDYVEKYFFWRHMWENIVNLSQTLWFSFRCVVAMIFKFSRSA